MNLASQLRQIHIFFKSSECRVVSHLQHRTCLVAVRIYEISKDVSNSSSRLLLHYRISVKLFSESVIRRARIRITNHSGLNS